MASSSAGAQPGNVIFGAFMPQGWKMELAGIDGAEAKWAAAVAIAQQAEDLGYDSIWVYDHVHNVPRPAHEAVFECWTTMAAISQRTSRIRLGQMVGCNSYRQPSLLAKITSTVDVISGGRLDWGIGAGWYENEYRGYGYEFPVAKDRIGMLRETVEIVRSMWTNPETTFDGQHYQLRRANCDPKPVQSPLPLLVGTRSPRMLRITARHADEWNTWGSPEQAAGHRAALIETCEKVGRDPATVRTSANALVNLDGSAPPPGRAALFGSAQQLVDQFGQYAALGFDEFILPDWNLGTDKSERADKLARIKTEVFDQVPG